VRWQKKAYGAFSPHMLLCGSVEAKDADRPPWLPEERGFTLRGQSTRSNTGMDSFQFYIPS